MTRQIGKRGVTDSKALANNRNGGDKDDITLHSRERIWYDHMPLRSSSLSGKRWIERVVTVKNAHTSSSLSLFY
jgi:hypothetical protein